jgi:hypothetical protein
MKGAKVVKSEPQTDSSPVILQLFAETFSSPRESDSHSYRVVVTLNMRSAHALRNELAHAYHNLSADDLFGE